MNSLPLEQQQYFLQHGHLRGDDDEDEDEGEEEEEEDEDGHAMQGIVGRGNGIGFFAEGDEDEGTFVKFNENANQL